jgi:hypothetical protein
MINTILSSFLLKARNLMLNLKKIAQYVESKQRADPGWHHPSILSIIIDAPQPECRLPLLRQRRRSDPLPCLGSSAGAGC